jgi:hypothetical protein
MKSRSPVSTYALYARSKSRGALGWGLLWLIGIPIPVLFVLFLLRGCT